MTTTMMMPGNTADIFLVHFFGDGLANERIEPRRIAHMSVDGLRSRDLGLLIDAASRIHSGSKLAKN